MARTRACIRILPQEYDSFVKAIPNNEHLPGAYDDWIKRSAEEDAHCIANGEVIKEVIVQYEEFAKYCLSTGQHPTYFVLMALAVSKAMVKPSA
jgi:hypothetical protein